MGQTAALAATAARVARVAAADARAARVVRAVVDRAAAAAAARAAAEALAVAAEPRGQHFAVADSAHGLKRASARTRVRSRAHDRPTRSSWIAAVQDRCDLPRDRLAQAPVTRVASLGPAMTRRRGAFAIRPRFGGCAAWHCACCGFVRCRNPTGTARAHSPRQRKSSSAQAQRRSPRSRSRRSKISTSRIVGARCGSVCSRASRRSLDRTRRRAAGGGSALCGPRSRDKRKSRELENQLARTRHAALSSIRAAA